MVSPPATTIMMSQRLSNATLIRFGLLALEVVRLSYFIGEFPRSLSGEFSAPPICPCDHRERRGHKSISIRLDLVVAQRTALATTHFPLTSHTKHVEKNNVLASLPWTTSPSSGSSFIMASNVKLRASCTQWSNCHTERIKKTQEESLASSTSPSLKRSSPPGSLAVCEQDGSDVMNRSSNYQAKHACTWPSQLFSHPINIERLTLANNAFLPEGCHMRVAYENSLKT